MGRGWVKSEKHDRKSQGCLELTVDGNMDFQGLLVRVQEDVASAVETDYLVLENACICRQTVNIFGAYSLPCTWCPLELEKHETKEGRRDEIVEVKVLGTHKTLHSTVSKFIYTAFRKLTEEVVLGSFGFRKRGKGGRCFSEPTLPVCIR